MNVAQIGTFDIANYGDLLFPLVARMRLDGITSVTCYAPRGGAPIWPDASPTDPIEALVDASGPVGGVLLGGGNLLHTSPWNWSAYHSATASGVLAYPRLWAGAAKVATQAVAPLCWNAPSVPLPLGPAAGRLLTAVAEQSAYVSVRDEGSAERLRQGGFAGDVEVVPDPALEVHRLWSTDQLDAAVDQAFRSRRRQRPDRLLAMHLNRRYAFRAADRLAGALDEMCARADAVGVLIAIGPCHGDDELQQAVGEQMTSDPLVVDTPASLREIAALIAASVAYVGSSLHGCITACAFGVPALAVVPRSASNHAKFPGFLQQFDLDGWIAQDWDEATARLPDLLAADRAAWASTVARAAPVLDAHWTRIADALQTGAAHSAGPAHHLDWDAALCSEVLPEVVAGIVSEAAQTVGALDGAGPSALRRVGEVLGQMTASLDTLARCAQQATDELARTTTRLRQSEGNLSMALATIDRMRQTPRGDAPPVEDGTGRGSPPERGSPSRGMSGRRRSITVVSWDLGHNPLGRSHMLAELLGRDYDVDLVGFQFERFGRALWSPFADTQIPVRSLPGRMFPHFTHDVADLARSITSDAVYVSKPRLPSFAAGMLAKSHRKRALVVDQDDRELSFFDEDEGITLDVLRGALRDPDAAVPFGRLWTRACDPLVRHADAVTVSNPALQAGYGGTIVPHARDESVFDPALYDKAVTRRRFGIPHDAKVVLFAGTPRLHKGVLRIAQALRSLGDPSLKLCLIGTTELRQLSPELAAVRDWLHVVDYQPFSQLPALLSTADAVCLLQDPGHEVSRYQIPAKVTDALAMGLPCLTTRVPPLADLHDDGVLIGVDHDDLADRIGDLFADYGTYAKGAQAGREVFLQRFSYSAVRPTVRALFDRLIEDPPALPGPYRECLSLIGSCGGDEPQPARQPQSLRAAPTPDDPQPVRRPPSRRDGWTPVPSVRRRSREPRYDIAMFWKQNDTGIYGRRQDMFVRYLMASGRVANLVHFDEPLDTTQLLETYRAGRGNGAHQARQVFWQTARRVTGVARGPRGVHYRTFLHRPDGAATSRLAQALPRSEDYTAYVTATLAHAGLGRRPMVFWVYPKNFRFPALVDAIRPDLVLADVVDDHRTWVDHGSSYHDQLTVNYAEILGRSDVVLANCLAVEQAMGQFADDIQVIPNACELPGRNRRRRRPSTLRGLQGPILGYVGNLSSRIDIDLLDRLARERPAYQLVLAGSAHLDRTILRLDRHPNVHFPGVLPYERAKRCIAAFDVAIIPHLDNAMTQTMNPLKVFVYAAQGVPVVSTGVANMTDLDSLVTMASDHDDFIAHVDRLVQSPPSREMSPEQQALLARNSWSRRVDRVIDLMDRTLEGV